MENAKGKTNATKVSASDLMEIMVDTNRKVTGLLKRRDCSASSVESYSKIGGLVCLLLMVIGAYLTIGIFLPQVYSWVGFPVTETIKLVTLAVYSVLAIIITAFARTRKLFKFISLLIAVSPIVIATILPLF